MKTLLALLFLFPAFSFADIWCQNEYGSVWKTKSFWCGWKADKIERPSNIDLEKGPTVIVDGRIYYDRIKTSQNKSSTNSSNTNNEELKTALDILIDNGTIDEIREKKENKVVSSTKKDKPEYKIVITGQEISDVKKLSDPNLRAEANSILNHFRNKIDEQLSKINSKNFGDTSCNELIKETDIIGLFSDSNSYNHQTDKFCKKHNIQYSNNCSWMTGNPFFPTQKMLGEEFRDKCQSKIASLKKDNPKKKKVIIIKKEKDRCDNPNYYDSVYVCKNYCMGTKNLSYKYCGSNGKVTKQVAKMKVEKAKCIKKKKKEDKNYSYPYYGC